MRTLHIQRYLITGLLTVVPLWITFLVFRFIASLLAQFGAPLIGAAFHALSTVFPGAAALFAEQWLISAIGFAATLLALYLIGWISNRVFGQRILAGLDALMERIPLVQSVYSGTKKLMAMLQNKPNGTQRVVLIDFPSPELKTIGFVTRVFADASGREMASVYVPTTPNPTGGYLEIVPVDKLTATDWSVDQAMAFVLSVGAVAPDAPFPATSPVPPRGE
ncbi:DUF502 domain-containing protein [Tahibacter amnicola]|uniref:DUF502 domain-containing protein n=1 Tax=Tahibacter amnicola TaxID=2976241 RepID=A0ABY6BNE6_9GAMM|nr:DUF502 domain-containing protein [Tahibacter amnicola]UXI69910.1 DUF502 domain-containing protein [Tahibacter amnicola]